MLAMWANTSLMLKEALAEMRPRGGTIMSCTCPSIPKGSSPTANTAYVPAFPVLSSMCTINLTRPA